MIIRKKLDAWKVYEGQWLFSIYLDYRLEMRLCGNGLKIGVFDILRKEKCSLHLIVASNAEISFWMTSSWLNAKMTLLPDCVKKTLLVKYTDVDILEKRNDEPIDESHQYFVKNAETRLPKWVFGTWKTVDDYIAIKIEKIKQQVFIAIWLDLSEDESSTKYGYYRVTSVYCLDSFHMRMLMKGSSAHSNTIEVILFFDHYNRKLRMMHSNLATEIKKVTERDDTESQT